MSPKRYAAVVATLVRVALLEEHCDDSILPLLWHYLLLPYGDNNVVETLQGGGVLGETELQEFTADIVDADSLAVPQLAHCLLHCLHRGLGRKRGVFGQLLDAVDILSVYCTSYYTVITSSTSIRVKIPPAEDCHIREVLL